MEKKANLKQATIIKIVIAVVKNAFYLGFFGIETSIVN